MQALGLVTISKKQNFVDILLEKISECKKLGLGPNIYISYIDYRNDLCVYAYLSNLE